MLEMIAAIWRRSLPQTLERLELLEKAAEQLANTRTLDSELHASAQDIAHKLAGSLGMFGFPDATAHARSIEQELAHPGLPQPERLQEHVHALRESLAQALEDPDAVTVER